MLFQTIGFRHSLHIGSSNAATRGSRAAGTQGPHGMRGQYRAQEFLALWAFGAAPNTVEGNAIAKSLRLWWAE